MPMEFKTKKMEKNKTIIPCIDKIMGLSSDYLCEYIYEEEIKSIEMHPFDLPTFKKMEEEK